MATLLLRLAGFAMETDRLWLAIIQRRPTSAGSCCLDYEWIAHELSQVEDILRLVTNG